MGKVNAKGRNSEPQGRFTRLDHKLQNSLAYRSLTPNAKALLFELVSLDTGQNNGALFLSEDDAAARIGISSKKAVRVAFADLVDAGLIVMTKGAHFNVKTGQGRARTWALTWIFDYHNRRPPSNAWRDCVPTGKPANRATKAMIAVKKYRREKKSTGVKLTLLNDNSQSETVNSTLLNEGDNEELPKNADSERVNLTQYTAVTTTPDFETGRTNSKHPEIPGGVFAVSGDTQ